MRYLIILFLVASAAGTSAQGSDTLRFTYDAGKAKMLKENIRLMAEYYNLDLADAEIQQTRLWDNPLFVWNAEMYSIAQNKYFNFGNQKLIQLEYAFSVSGRRINAVKEARIGKELAELALGDVIRGLVLEYSNAFFESIELLEMNVVLEETQTQYDKLIEQYTKGEELGINSESELVRLKAERQAILAEINENEQALLQVNLQLKMLMNYPATVNLVPEKPVQMLKPDYALDKLFAEAAKKRPDLLIAERNIDFYEANLKKQKSMAVPTVNLGYQPHDAGSNYVRPYMGMVFEMGVPIFNRNQGQIAKAKVQIKQGEQLRDYKREEVKNEIIMAAMMLERSQNLRESFGHELMNQMEELSGNARINYEKRNISLYEYIDFQRSYLRNKLNYIQANRKFNEAINLLNFTVGADLNNQ